MKKIALAILLIGSSFVSKAQYYPTIIDSIITAERGSNRVVTIANPIDYNKSIMYEGNQLKHRTTHYFELEMLYKRNGEQGDISLMLVADSTNYYGVNEVATKECKVKVDKKINVNSIDCNSDVYTYNLNYSNGVTSWKSRDFQQTVEYTVKKNGNEYTSFSEVIKKGERVISSSNYFFFYAKDRIYLLDLVPDENQASENGIMDGSLPQPVIYRTNFLYELCYKSGKLSEMNEYTIDEWDVQAISAEYIQQKIKDQPVGRNYSIIFSDKVLKNQMLTKKNINAYLKMF